MYYGEEFTLKQVRGYFLFQWAYMEFWFSLLFYIFNFCDMEGQGLPLAGQGAESVLLIGRPAGAGLYCSY